MLHYLRACLRPFAIQAAYNPIESIVFFFVIGTLGYFHILNAIKHSSFFAPSVSPQLRPAHAVFNNAQWISVADRVWRHSSENPHLLPLEFQQLIFTSNLLPLTTPILASSILNATNHLSTSYHAASGLTYPSTCYRPANNSGPCFTHQQASLRSFTHTFAFVPGARDAYVAALLHSTAPPDASGTSFSILQNGPAPSEPVIGQMKSSKWMAYAARALVLRFYTLAQKADSLDILLILLGYVLMHTTFYLLISRSRALGSNFWLPCAIMSSSVVALLLSLPIAMALRIPIDPVALTEALPFLVCTVGFDKPLRLARAVFLHPHLTTPPVALSSLPPSTLSPTHPNHHALPLKPAAKILTESLKLTYHPIIRDYILEIAVLLVGANSKVAGLREVCALAALLLAVDCFVMITYLVAVLGVMIEVRRIRAVRAITRSSRSTRSRSSSISSMSSITSAQSPKPIVASSGRPSAMAQALAPPTFFGRLLGVKGSSLVPVKGSKASRREKESAAGENPVARLKLLLIASFTTLHILNLITPLAPAYEHGHTMTSRNGMQEAFRRVNITEKDVKSALDALALASHEPPSAGPYVDVDMYAEEEEKKQLLVKIAPPIWVRVDPSPELVASVHPHPHATATGLDSFMSSWTRLVGDPVLSKWIVVALAISILLNGYLLKGIAAGLGLGLGLVRKEGDGVRFSDGEEVEAEAEGVVKIKRVGEEEEVVEVERERKVKVKKSAAVPTFTLEDVDRRLATSPTVRKRRGTLGSSVQSPVASPVVQASTFQFPTAPAPVHRATVPVPTTTPAPPSDEIEVVVRSLKECVDIYENGPRPASVALDSLNDEEVIMLAQHGKIAAYALEKVLGPERLERAVRVRRALVSRASNTKTLEYADIPMSHYDYSRVLGACCENVVGYIPLPLGIAGPLNVDGTLYPIPMATAEGTLVASTSRGCKALNAGGGVTTVLTKDGMTRGPAIDFPSVVMAADAQAWIASEEGYGTIKEAFESTSRFAKLRDLKTAMAGRTLYVRFATATGDAMGMNMISKGTERALEVMRARYPEMDVLALSGNYCTDKKPAAINWIEGRGKSVVAEAVIPGRVVSSVLKTSVGALCNLNVKKNLVGSAMAGSVGGFNAHAANILTAVFLATGQDPAQNVESSNCMTLMEPTNDGEDLLMTVTMPCIEVGTVGGGTVLAPQQAVLEMLGIKGAHPTHPGQNAQRLARVIAAAVMAGELSLLSALAAGHLVRAHLVHNRSQPTTPAMTPGSAYGAGGMLVPEAKKEEAGVGVVVEVKPLTPSSSTASLPPYVR